MGVELGPDEVAYRCNLVTLSTDEPPVMVDFAAGHPTNAQSHPIVAALDAELGDGRDGVRFHPGVEYRHLCVVPKRLGRRGVHAAARPHRSRRGLPERSGRAEAPRADGRVARCRRRASPAKSVRRRRRSGCGAKACARRSRRSPRRTASRAACRRRSISCKVSVCSPASTSSTFPARRAGFDNDYAAQARACIDSLDDRDAVRAARRSDRRGRTPGTRRREGRRARAVGPRRHRSDRRRARRRRASRTGSCCCPTTRRRARSRRTPPTRCRTCCSTRPSTGPAASTPKPATGSMRPGAGARADGASRRTVTVPRRRRSAAGRVRQGMRRQLGGFSFRLLHPAPMEV